MREPKFRAWDGKKIHRVGMLTWSMRPGPFWGALEEVKSRPGTINFDWIDLKDSTLMQYTGLKDKNGREIYAKCDVLRSKSEDGFEHRDTVEFDWSNDGEYGLIWSTSRNIVRKQDLIDKRYEVIGIIYEDPELLEAAK